MFSKMGISFKYFSKEYLSLHVVYFGSDLEGNLLLLVIKNSTFSAHMVYCPSTYIRDH